MTYRSTNQYHFCCIKKTQKLMYNNLVSPVIKKQYINRGPK